jgi:hypothetical protein
MAPPSPPGVYHAPRRLVVIPMHSSDGLWCWGPGGDCVAESRRAHLRDDALQLTLAADSRFAARG